MADNVQRWQMVRRVSRLGGMLVLLTAFNAVAQVEVQTGNSLNPVGSGARALGHGNAFIAIADDATAASWNPGGLSQLERPEVSFAYEANWRHESLSSDANPRMAGAENLGLYNLNYLSGVYPFLAGKNMVMSLNYLRLYEFGKDMSFPLSINEPGVAINARYDMEQRGAFSVVAPAYGIDVTDRLSLGATLNIWNHDLTQSSTYTKTESTVGQVSYGALNADYSYLTRNRYVVDEGYSLVLGSLYRPSKSWTVGAVVKPGFRLTMDHYQEKTYVQTGDLGPRNDYTVTKDEVQLHYPWILGTGVAYRASDALTISSDVTWTQWSHYHLRTATESQGNPITAQPENQGQLDNAYTARLGAEYLIVREKYVVPLRCGAGYDPTPGVAELDEYYTVNFGTGFQTGRFMWDIGYELRWGRDVNGGMLQGLGATQDVMQHRIMTSLIIYF